MKTMTIAIRTTIVTIVLTGILYPFVMTGLAQVLFPWRANGSLVTDEKGQVVGSELIAQGFANPAVLTAQAIGCGREGLRSDLFGWVQPGYDIKKIAGSSGRRSKDA